MSNLLCTEAKELAHWRDKVVKGEDLFLELLTDGDLENAQLHLDLWLKFFDREIAPERSRITQAEYSELLEQWNHAARMLLCARFVHEHRDEFPQMMDQDRKAVVQKVGELATNVFRRKIEITPPNILVLCSLFLEGTSTVEVRSVPFATVNIHNVGQIYTLELQRVRSYQTAMRNPSVFPNVSCVRKIVPDFGQAIQNALDINASLWQREVKDDRTCKLSSQPEKENKEEEIAAMGRELALITSYGIIWDVKPYAATRTAVVLDELSGESVGLAAFSAIYFTLRDKYPDSRAILAAQLDGGSTKLSIAPVKGVPAKIEAAIKINRGALEKDKQAIPPFDGFGIHRDNFNELSEDFKVMIAKEQFQILVLNDDGSLIETYPETSVSAQNGAR
jgi:hypothetical protein